MSGHSKWAKIKRDKGITDQKRGAVFTKLGNAITLAARNGADPSMNFVLRLAMDKAKAANMPKDNIQKAIDRGAGTGKDAIIFEGVAYEGYLGGDVAFIIDCFTDNKNRTFAEIKKSVESCGGNLGAANSVLWQFDEKGKVVMYLAKIIPSKKYGDIPSLERVTDKDSAMLEIMDIAGVEDVSDIELEFETNDELKGETNYFGFEIITEKSSLNSVYKAIEGLGYKIESAEIVKVAKNPIVVDEIKEGKAHRLIVTLEDLDDVQNVWVNLK